MSFSVVFRKCLNFFTKKWEKYLVVSEESRNFALAFRDRGPVTCGGDADAPFMRGGWTGCRPDEKNGCKSCEKPDEKRKSLKLRQKFWYFKN